MALDDPEYTLAATITALDGWANRGRRMYPVEVAQSAVYWMRKLDPSILEAALRGADRQDAPVVETTGETHAG